MCCLTYLLHIRPMSRYTREYGRTSSWYNKEWAPPSKHYTKNSYSGWNKRCRRGYPSEYEGRLNQWEEGKLSDSAMDNEAATDESQRLRTSKLLELQRLLKNREGRPGATCKKKRRGEHQGPRSQPKDHAGPGHFNMRSSRRP